MLAAGLLVDDESFMYRLSDMPCCCTEAQQPGYFLQECTLMETEWKDGK